MAAEDSGAATPATEQSLPSTTATSMSVHDELPKGPIRTPFAHPLSTTKPVARPPLTEEQETKYKTLFNTVSQWTTVPSSNAKGASEEPINEDELMWLSRECLLRYLRATKWDVTFAVKRLQSTLAWRREFKVATITADHVGIESETGKQFILGFDNDARPILYQCPGRQNTKKSERQIEHMVFMLEKLIQMMEVGQETSCLIISFANSTSGGSPSVAQGKQVLNILQDHYPERLGKALISDLPWYINTFFKLITPFIDPITREKMAFNEGLRKYVPPAQLDHNFGGDADFEYEHDKYWPALNKMCDERQAAYKDRWVQGGKRVGEFEAYMRGGSQKSLAEVEKEGAASA